MHNGMRTWISQTAPWALALMTLLVHAPAARAGPVEDITRIRNEAAAEMQAVAADYDERLTRGLSGREGSIARDEALADVGIIATAAQLEIMGILADNTLEDAVQAEGAEAVRALDAVEDSTSKRIIQTMESWLAQRTAGGKKEPATEPAKPAAFSYQSYASGFRSTPASEETWVVRKKTAEGTLDEMAVAGMQGWKALQLTWPVVVVLLVVLAAVTYTRRRKAQAVFG